MRSPAQRRVGRGHPFDHLRRLVARGTAPGGTLGSDLIIQTSSAGHGSCTADALVGALPPGLAHWLQEPSAGAPLQPGSAGFFVPDHPARLSVLGSAARRWLAESGARPAACIWVLPDGIDALPAPLPIEQGVLCMHCSEDLAVYLLRRTLARLCAPRVVVHGVMVEVFGLGVLISGSSGQGKSELALELLTRGHGLVADDAVELVRGRGDYLVGYCPWLLHGFLEVRGLGILDVPRMFGARALRRPSRLDLIIRLYPAQDHAPDYVERLEGLRTLRRSLGVDTPEISLPVSVGHNLATLLEAACRDHWLRIQGYRADQEFAQRQQFAIDQSR